MNNLTGKIIKGIGGFYYVKTCEGIVECRARGNFRKKDILPYVGDDVAISAEDDGTGYVLEIKERKNRFIRPPISNIDKMVIVVALRDPAPDFLFIDKLLVTAEHNNVEAAVCFNKADICENFREYVETYENAGYKVFVTSAKDNWGVDEVRNYMKNSVTAVCGFSGVGKSSLLNAITCSDSFAVGDISTKLSRGKHTTRHVELYEYGENSYIADTPGFSMLSLNENIDSAELIECFPDLQQYVGECRFADCSHVNNRFCGVCKALDNKLISKTRYDNYCYLYNTLSDNKEWKK